MSTGQRLLLICLLLAIVSVLSACEPPSAISPFYLPADIIFDKDLIGTWTADYGSSAKILTLAEDAGDKNAYSVMIKALGKESVGKAVMFRSNGTTFMDFYPDANVRASELEHEYIASDARTHTVFYFRREGHVLDIAPLASMWISETVPAKDKLPGSSLVLTLNTAELQELLAKALNDPQQLFREHIRFVAEDTTDDYKQMVVVGNMKLATQAMDEGDFLKAAPYADAVLAIRPQEPSMHFIRAFALIASNKPVEARQEVATWENYCSVWNSPDLPFDDCKKGNGDVSDGMNGLAFFVEAKWQESFDALGRFRHNFNYFLEHARMLQVLALYSMGKKKEAVEAADKEEDWEGTAKFLNDQLTADAYFAEATDNEGKEAKSIFIASRFYADGEKTKALEWFQRQLEFRDNLVFAPIAQARIVQLRLETTTALH